MITCQYILISLAHKLALLNCCNRYLNNIVYVGETLLVTKLILFGRVKYSVRSSPLAVMKM